LSGTSVNWLRPVIVFLEQATIKNVIIIAVVILFIIFQSFIQKYHIAILENTNIYFEFVK
ncbi:MAG: hypothetical protein WCJ80_14530, partial [Bacteroidota bacterium]